MAFHFFELCLNIILFNSTSTIKKRLAPFYLFISIFFILSFFFTFRKANIAVILNDFKIRQDDLSRLSGSMCKSGEEREVLTMTVTVKERFIEIPYLLLTRQYAVLINIP